MNGDEFDHSLSYHFLNRKFGKSYIFSKLSGLSWVDVYQQLKHLAILMFTFCAMFVLKSLETDKTLTLDRHPLKLKYYKQLVIYVF